MLSTLISAISVFLSYPCRSGKGPRVPPFVDSGGAATFLIRRVSKSVGQVSFHFFLGQLPSCWRDLHMSIYQHVAKVRIALEVRRHVVDSLDLQTVTLHLYFPSFQWL